MDCPACDGKMRHRRRRGVEIDVCVKCRGVWLDANELDGILGIEGDKSVEAALVAVAAAPEVCRYCNAALDGDQFCSKCDQKAVLECPRDSETLSIVDAAGLELDRCPGCAGLWVDGFERTKLSKMTGDLMKRAEAIGGVNLDGAQGDGGEEIAVMMGMMMTDGISVDDGTALAEGFGFGVGGPAADAEPEEASAEAGEPDETQEGEPVPKEPLGGTRSMREYIEKHGNFEIACTECEEVLTRYTAWQCEGEFFCMSCGDAKMGGSVERAIKCRASNEADYWHDEGHLVEVLKWIVGGIIPGKR